MSLIEHPDFMNGSESKKMYTQKLKRGIFVVYLKIKKGDFCSFIENKKGDFA